MIILSISKHESKHVCKDKTRVGPEGRRKGDLSGEEQQGECSLNDDADGNDGDDDDNVVDDDDDDGNDDDGDNRDGDDGKCCKI